MWEWAGSEPQRCFKLGNDAAAWAETERNWRGRRRHRCVVSPLPDGLLKPSPANLNLSDVSTMQGRLRALAARAFVAATLLALACSPGSGVSRPNPTATSS